MALYKDGNPVSGLNSIPRLTLAQYESQNVKPEFWVWTDAPESYKKLSADQVSYDSNNTVEDMIDSLLNRSGFLQFKVMYISTNANITFDAGNYILLFMKNQYAQSALYTIESGYNPCQIGGQTNAITQSESNNRITLNMNNTYGTVILAKLYVTSNDDEIHLVNGTT